MYGFLLWHINKSSKEDEPAARQLLCDCGFATVMCVASVLCMTYIAIVIIVCPSDWMLCQP